MQDIKRRKLFVNGTERGEEWSLNNIFLRRRDGGNVTSADENRLDVSESDDKINLA